MNQENSIVSANESRFNAANYSEALTAFTAGWVDPENISKMLDFIAPPIPVGRRFEFKRSSNAEAFLSESDDLRAVGAEFKRVSYQGESVNEKTINKGLTVRVDHDEVFGDDWQERYTQTLLQRLLRNELRRAVAALDSIAGEADSVLWENRNPDNDIRNMISAAADSSGVRPNRLLFGEGAWNRRITSLEYQNTQVAGRGGISSKDDLAEKFMVDACEVLSSRYQSGANTKSIVGGGMSIYAFYARDGISKDEPSNLKRFYTPNENGGAFRVYCEEHAKYTDITVEHYSTIAATSSLGVRKLIVLE